MKNNGFTLLEVLFALGILSLFLLLTVPIQFSILESQQEKQFFQTFESDMLYMQNMSYASTNYVRLSIDAENNKYEINIGSSSVDAYKPIIRQIPKNWHVKKRLLMGSTISFNANGTISQPGNIEITTNNAKYNIIFPLGKGRCYIEKK